MSIRVLEASFGGKLLSRTPHMKIGQMCVWSVANPHILQPIRVLVIFGKERQAMKKGLPFLYFGLFNFWSLMYSYTVSISIGMTEAA